jgi:hypothetical protein
MLIFFDETFRQSLKHPQIPLGALCGIGIPEKELSIAADDIYRIKNRHMGIDFARNGEIKGKELFKNWVFRLMAKGVKSKNVALAEDIIDYIVNRKLPVFGCVCFEKKLQRFQVEDVTALDKTFFFLFERIDTWMKINRPGDMACIIFDDRDYGINQKNSEAITNFFQRSSKGISFNSIVKTPFFAISQSQNVGLQLADLITTIIGLRFSSSPLINPYFSSLKRTIPSYVEKGWPTSCLKVIRGGQPETMGEDIPAGDRSK